MEAVALMLIHLLTPGGLSWTRNGVPRTDAEHDRLIREKRKARPEDLCRGLPAEFEEFLRYCRRLKFEACPDYNYWVNEFRELLGENGYPTSSRFVWPPLDPKVCCVKLEPLIFIVLSSDIPEFNSLRCALCRQHDDRQQMTPTWWAF